MKGAWRLTIAGLAAALLLGQAPALAQEAPAPATTNAPAADTVGPRELQNFTLQGNVTRPADQPAQQPAAEPPTATRQQPAVASSTPREPLRRPAETPKPAPRTTSPAPRQSAQAQPEPQAVIPMDTAPLPTSPAAASQSAPAFPTASEVPTEHRLSLLPWLLAAIVLAGGGIFLFWRNRSRPAFAGGPQIDMFSAPEPAPAPAPRPQPAPASRRAEAPPAPRRQETPPTAPAPLPAGIVSTALRPWVDVNAQPLRCIVSEDSVTIEFELELFNSGNAPARDILIEALIVNAGPTQDQELAAFFTRPPGPGNRIELIHPLTRTAFTTQVVTARDHISVLEAGGRELFVPLLAFNAFYRRGSGDAQTSVAYLLGRDGNGGGKMAPFRIDQGARVFRGLGARQLPNGVRR